MSRSWDTIVKPGDWQGSRAESQEEKRQTKWKGPDALLQIDVVLS
jgi:hypothetical protein